jgi:hypothetical protein
METPYLVQRLKKLSGTQTVPNNLMGYYQGPKRELTQEERNTINSIFKVDYMGSSEFEFGAFPKALREIAQLNLETWTLTLTGVPYEFMGGKQPVVTKSVEVFILSKPEDKNDITVFFNDQITKKSVRLKECTQIQEGLFGRWEIPYKKRKYEITASDISAWLDLENHWIATTNATQLKLMKTLLLKTT